MRALRQGECADTADIARRFGFSDPHVRRILRFAYLAPDMVEAIVDCPQKSEVERLWASNAKARELLAWQPQYGGLKGFQRGLAETVAWFKDASHLASYKSEIYNI